MRPLHTKSAGIPIRWRALTCLAMLALALSACSFTTDTVATVGGERITRGELNAEVTSTGQPASTALNYLITSRLLALEARAQNITVTDAELRAKTSADVAATGQQLQDQRVQTRTSIATDAAQSIRPIVDAAGGAALPQPELVALLTDEIGKIQNQLDARGTLLASGISQRFIQDEAISIRNDLAGKGVAVAPADLEPTVAGIVQKLGTGGSTAADAFQQALSQQGYSGSAGYLQSLRIQALIEKMRPSWYKSAIDAATLKLLVTDSQARANEAVQKGRAGTAFDELVKTYASVVYQDPQAVDSLGSRPLDDLPQEIRSSFPSLQQGQYSAPVALPSGLYAVVYINAIEHRAPTADDENSLVGQWLQSLHAKYPVTISPSLNATAPAATP